MKRKEENKMTEQKKSREKQQEKHKELVDSLFTAKEIRDAEKMIERWKKNNPPKNAGALSMYTDAASLKEAQKVENKMAKMPNVGNVRGLKEKHLPRAAAMEGMLSPAHGAVLNYLKTVSRPFSPPADFGKCPVNYNSAPSFQSTTATTKYSGSAYTVANSTSELALYPGHFSMYNETSTGAGDPFAFHTSLCSLGVGPTNYTIGPVDSNLGGTVPNAIGALVTGLALGASTNTFTGAGSYALTPMSALPYVASGTINHTRWKMLSMGIKIFNDTPLATRGGYVGSCQPNSPFFGATQTLYSVFGSYQTSVASTDAVQTIVWIPRTEDLAFWHTINASSNPSNSIAGLRVWLNNDTVSGQNWRYEIVCHWELAGTSLASITTPALALPGGKDVVEPALDIVRAASPSGGVLDKVGAAVAAASTSAAAFSGAVKGFSGSGVMGTIGEILKSAL